MSRAWWSAYPVEGAAMAGKIVVAATATSITGVDMRMVDDGVRCMRTVRGASFLKISCKSQR